MAVRSFKSDDSFLEKLAIGAVGTKRVMEDLIRLDQDPIELERGSTGYKLWKGIKIKRVRVPDVLCVRTGIRVECRAKQKLAITMSHSTSDPDRGWDAGLQDDDYIALVMCRKAGETPVSWEAGRLVQYVKTADLRKAYQRGEVLQERPKGAQEGFESRLTWPAAVASASGTVVDVNDSRLQFKRESDGRTITLKLSKKGIALETLVGKNADVEQGQVLASVVPVTDRLPRRTVSHGHYARLLKSSSITDRYTAAKAMSHLKAASCCITLLERRVADENEHIYVRLEAAASLVRVGCQDGFKFLRSMLEAEYLEHRLETVIILGELPGRESQRRLAAILCEPGQHPEIRAGAAWALGELGGQKSVPVLVTAFESSEPSIRQEAARALKRMCGKHIESVLGEFRRASETVRPGVAWALGHAGNASMSDLLADWKPEDLDRRQWTSWILGQLEADSLVDEIEDLREFDPEVYFAATVLWKILASWTCDLREY